MLFLTMDYFFYITLSVVSSSTEKEKTLILAVAMSSAEVKLSFTVVSPLPASPEAPLSCFPVLISTTPVQSWNRPPTLPEVTGTVLNVFNGI